MINKLTDDQVKLLDKVRQKWIDLSFTYKELTWQNLRPYYKWLYSLANLKEPLVVVLESPMALQIGANFVGNLSQVASQVWSQVGSQVESQVRSQVRSQVWSQVWSQVESQVESQVRSQVGSQVRSQVGSQVESQVRSQVESQVESQVRSQVESQKMNWFSCWESQLSSDSAWVSFYDFFSHINLISNKEFVQYRMFLEQGVWMSILLDGIVFVCPAPYKISRRSDGVFHNENGPAYEFKNGEKYWVLNGVAVPEWLVTTHSDQLDPQKILAIENADQRAEGIRKLGIERLSKYGKVVDSYKNYNNDWFEKSKYELIDMTKIFKSHKHAYFLKMQNQSVPGVWHMEGVHPDCNTLDKAIRWRLDVKSKNYEIMEIK